MMPRIREFVAIFLIGLVTSLGLSACSDDGGSDSSDEEKMADTVQPDSSMSDTEESGDDNEDTESMNRDSSADNGPDDTTRADGSSEGDGSGDLSVSDQGVAKLALSGGVELQLTCETFINETGSRQSFKREGETVFEGEKFAGIDISCEHDGETLVESPSSVSFTFYRPVDGEETTLTTGTYELSSLSRSPSWYNDKDVVTDLTLEAFFDDFGMEADVESGSVTIDTARPNVVVFNGSANASLQVPNDVLGIDEEGNQTVTMEVEFRSGSVSDLEAACQQATESCSTTIGEECFSSIDKADRCDCKSELIDLYECKANNCSDDSCQSEQETFDGCSSGMC